MVSVGLKALVSRRARSCNLVEDSLMGEKDKSHKHDKRKKKAKNASFAFDGDNSTKSVSGPGRVADGTFTRKKFSKHKNTSDPQPLVIR